MISESEKEDFSNAITNNGFKENEFKLVEEDTTVCTVGIYPITGEVTINRIPNNKTKTYQSGHGSAWAAAFQVDLKSGFFGQSIIYLEPSNVPEL